MPKTITGNLSYRKQFALKAILDGRTDSRNFDNCFEMGDGDEVVKFIMKKALAKIEEPNWIQSETNPRAKILTTKEDDERFSAIVKRERLAKALKEGGFYDGWKKFFEEENNLKN